jgi:hypothetical protein
MGDVCRFILSLLNRFTLIDEFLTLSELLQLILLLFPTFLP